MATIITKFSSTSSAVPTASDLVQGELAVNTADKRLFTENSSATIIEIGTNPSSITTGAITASGTVTANSSLLSSNATFTGGTVNGMVIGGSTPQAITGTLITANTNFAGALTGNVTGNVTGNLTGNITGDVTGNLTASSGTTTVANLVVNGTVDFTDTVLTNLAAPSSDTDAATKGYVDTQVTNVIDSAPAALDTLNELAAALGDDANFSTTITNSIAAKLPLAGGTMTGDITFNAGQAFPGVLPLSGGTMTGDITFNSGQTIDGYVPQTATDGAANVPAGATGDRPGSPVTGQFRFNTTSTSFEGYNGTSWGAVGGGATGGGTDAWALEHDNTITTDYTIGTGKNVINAGPMTINSGVTVTVPTGSSWSIV